MDSDTVSIVVVIIQGLFGVWIALIKRGNRSRTKTKPGSGNKTKAMVVLAMAAASLVTALYQLDAGSDRSAETWFVMFVVQLYGIYWLLRRAPQSN
jgi:hypothetical protein